MSVSNPANPDVIIVGAGPAGSTTAFFLAREGIRVTLVDQARFPRDKVCGDGISPRAPYIMEKMGLLSWAEDNFPKQKVRLGAPDGTVVEAPGAPGDPPFDYEGFVIPRKTFDNALVERAVAVGAHLMEGTRITAMERLSPGRVRAIGRQQGRAVTFEAPLLISAEGATSSVIRKLGLVPGPAEGLATRQYFEEIDHEEPGLIEIHWEQSILPGYGWVFHLGGGRANVGIGMYAQEARERKVNFHQLLETFITNNPYARRVTAKARPLGHNRGFPLRMDAHVVTPYLDNVVVVGEAAGLVHPMSGEGIGPSMICAEIAAEHVREALVRGDFSAAQLAAYGRVFRKTFGPIHRAARFARKFMEIRPFVNRTMHRAQHDDRIAITLSKIIRGVASPLSLMTPGMSLRVLRG